MARKPAVSFPWIEIPPVAQTGQTRAFANREEHVTQLYKALVSAGNAVRAGSVGVRQRFVVSGYMGVGKSALILQVLGMLRGELDVAAGLPEPDDRERWLILRTSGKHVPSVESIADALRRCALSVFEEVQEEAEHKLPGVLELPLLHRLFRRREAKLFKEVSSSLSTLAQMIEYVHVWQGSTLSVKVQSATESETGRNVEAELLTELKRQRNEPTTAEARAAFKLAVNYVRKQATATRVETSLERQRVIGADLVVEALNGFFKATERAGIPTILVLDDFDEFASNVGPSHEHRSRVLSSVLGEFTQLKPTFLVIGLREEYMHEDVFRQYRTLHVPPLTRSDAVRALAAWGAVQQPPLREDVVDNLQYIGNLYLERFASDEPVVIPFRFLQLVTWTANNCQDWYQKSRRDLATRYLRGCFASESVRALLRICRVMPEEDIRHCAEAVPLDPTPYALSRYERHALEKAGLLRPAVAGDPDDPRIVLDPLCAYVAADPVPGDAGAPGEPGAAPPAAAPA